MNESADKYILQRLGCQYLGPDYDPRTSRQSPAPYCGCKDLHNDTLYCKTHYSIMYQEGTANRKRHKDIRTANQVWDLESMFNEAVLELEKEAIYE